MIEPLARYDEKGDLVPYLAQEIPTVENGGVSAGPAHDHLEAQGRAALVGRHAGHRRGRGLHLAVLHRPGRRLRADPELHRRDERRGGRSADDQGHLRACRSPSPTGRCVGAQAPIIQKKQFADCLGAKAPDCTEANTKPIGTGPFVVTDFKANDVVLLEANPNFRDPAKPAFATLVLKGGGDAASAARSVLETGEFDYAWNTQVEPEILAQMAGRPGRAR